MHGRHGDRRCERGARHGDKDTEKNKQTNIHKATASVHRSPVVPVRPRLRALRFAGGCSAFAVVGDAVSELCALRLSDVFDIEMSRLEDVPVTPNARLQRAQEYPRFHENLDDDEDNASDGEDDGAIALLGPGVGPRWRDRLFGEEKSVRYHIQSIVVETAPTLLFTTTGLMLTGELLDRVSQREAMTRIKELIMIVPVVLNLKGNLEMNLSARLSTASNMGELDKPATRNSIILGNLALLQVQATVVSFVAAIVSFILGLIVPSPNEPPSEALSAAGNSTALFHLARSTLHSVRVPRPVRPGPKDSQSGFVEFIMVAASAMSATCVSAALLGSFMCGLVVLCRKLGRDPDNIAPPIAACLGDLLTLLLLSIISSALIHVVNTPIPFIVIVLVVLSSFACGAVTLRNPNVKHLLTQGWSPLFGAMVISSGTGIVLDTFVDRYEGYALLATVISGLPGNVGSILTSRLSTALHAAAAVSLSSTSPQKPSRGEPSTRLVMLTLLCVALPILVIYLVFLRAVGWLHLPIVFLAVVFPFFGCGVSIALLLARALTNLLWSRGLDPDMYALPIHSASMDLIGQLLLVSCFELVSALGLKVRASAKA
ncbi:hypothetical protein EWM64_g1807 [Hericium alpestre]|uniref:SLC41A/MgtE integral membrane domain-containing protein n=1 Tax=Hericium alpestre TaxID=135208 RepID=A0A4Z0A7F9_9AGAM|nr:hypothetical protein EWM64_g1807 [Hericium alpestre]